MLTINLRSKGLPASAVIMVKDASLVSGYTQECTLNGKFIKGVATACTNPGACSGASTHTHVSHGHQHTGCAPGHTHGFVLGYIPSVACSGPPTTYQQWAYWDNSGPRYTQRYHYHLAYPNLGTVSDCVPATLTTDTQGCHTHDSVSNDPENRTLSFYRKDSDVSLRSKSLPHNSLLFYGGCSLPSHFSVETNYNGKHIKGCTVTQTNGGSNTHTHSCSSAHTHSGSVGSHTHPVCGTTPPGGCEGNPRSLSSGASMAYGNHTHSLSGSLTTVTGSSPTTSGSAAGHNHGAKSHEVAYKELNIASLDYIAMRECSMSSDFLAVWLNPLACIPENYANADGTCGTINMLSKYPKGAAVAGGTGGSSTHTHCADVAHGHTISSMSHTHTQVLNSLGTSNSNFNGYNAPTNWTSPNNGFYVKSHNSHQVPSNSLATSVSGCLPNAPSHDHGATTSEPPTKVVAFIQRV